jgi:transketolase
MKLADHVGQVLSELAANDSRVVVLDGDLADSDGAIHFARALPDRFLMAGIAEQSMVSVAAGMAATGLRPWVFSFAAFLCYRAYDQIRICLSQANQPVVLVGSHAGGLAGRNGKTHAALNDLALMLSLPAMNVWAPADFADAELSTRMALAENAPAYIRMPRRQFAPDATGLPGSAAPLRWILPSAQLTLVSTGLATHWALGAASILRERGLKVGLLHCLRLKPNASLAAELSGARMIVTVEDHCLHGGLGTLVRQACPAVQVISHGWPDEFTGKSGSDSELLHAHHLTGRQLADAIWTLVEGHKNVVDHRILA